MRPVRRADLFKEHAGLRSSDARMHAIDTDDAQR
jgi:hypothetical protein